MSNHNTYICSLKSLPYKILIYWAMCFAKFLTQKWGFKVHYFSAGQLPSHINTFMGTEKCVSWHNGVSIVRQDYSIGYVV